MCTVSDQFQVLYTSPLGLPFVCQGMQFNQQSQVCILQTRNYTSSVNVYISPEYCTVSCTLCCFLTRSGCCLGMQGTVASEHSCLTWLYMVLFWVSRHVNGIHDATVVSSNSSEGVHVLWKCLQIVYSARHHKWPLLVASRYQR